MRILVFCLLLLVAQTSRAQQFEIVPDAEGAIVVKGIINIDWLLKHPELGKEYQGRPPGYTPDSKALQLLREKGDSLQFVIFMGTWCEDSRFVVPRLFHLFDAAGYPKEKLTLIACDRNKKTLGNLQDAFNVKNVPTVIVMKNGKEIARVVEYGSTGLVDKELAEQILALP